MIYLLLFILMDNAYTHTDSSPSCDSGSCDSGSTVDLQSFAAGFLLAAAFFTAPMFIASNEVTASLVEHQDVDNDGIPDYNDAGLGPVAVDEDVCVEVDLDEDGEISEDEACPEVSEDTEDTDAEDTEAVDLGVDAEDADADAEAEAEVPVEAEAPAEVEEAPAQEESDAEEEAPVEDSEAAPAV